MFVFTRASRDQPSVSKQPETWTRLCLTIMSSLAAMGKVGTNFRSPSPSKTSTADGSRSELECRLCSCSIKSWCSVFPPPSYLTFSTITQTDPQRSHAWSTSLVDCSIFPESSFAIVVPQCLWGSSSLLGSPSGTSSSPFWLVASESKPSPLVYSFHTTE